jgi:hypothetical protein
VQVEVRAEHGRAFGNGRKRSMVLRDFLDQVSAGNEGLYMTTQTAAEDADNFPALLTPPLDTLTRQGLPLRPAVMGNLIPQAINLWLGCAREGSSSGLHHDYHDNLYVLLRGRKRFRLYPPATAPGMYTQGKVAKIHHNGRCGGPESLSTA